MAAVVVDQDRHAVVANALVERVARQKIEGLSRNGVIEVSHEGLSKQHEGLVFDQLGIFFLKLEGRSGRELGNSIYLPALGFGVFPTGPGVPGSAFTAASLLGSDRGADLHGGVNF